jgi:hypothetical protein
MCRFVDLVFSKADLEIPWFIPSREKKFPGIKMSAHQSHAFVEPVTNREFGPD